DSTAGSIPRLRLSRGGRPVRCGGRQAFGGADVSASLLRGHVEHKRHSPVTHAFSYPVVFARFDLDGLPRLDDLWPLAGYNRPAVLSVRDGDYLGDGPGSVAEKWRRLWADRCVAERVELLTVPRILGCGYNPVNFYLGYLKTFLPLFTEPLN